MKKKNRGDAVLPREVHEAFKQESEQHQKEMEQVWSLIDAETHRLSAVSSKEELNLQWNKLRRRISTPASAHRPVERIRSLRRLWQFATAAVLAVLMGAYAYWSRPVVVEAGYGETARASLPDGSVIQLNSGSSISYDRGFDGNPFASATVRQVSLEGEAYFDIEPSETPFVVHTFNAEVRVLGTEFNIRARREETERATTVVLAEGRVEVSSREATNTIFTLDEPGQTARIGDANEARSERYFDNLERALIWRSGGFAVQNETLARVFAELERRHGISITTQAPDILADSLTILLSSPGNIESILNDICSAKNLKYRAVSRGYMVYRQ